MPKLRKQRRRQKFRYDRNRKRVKNSVEKTHKERIKISNDTMKELWDRKKSVLENMTAMGVAFDANKAVAHKGTKAILVERAKGNDPAAGSLPEKNFSRSEVIRRLEAEAADAAANQKSTFRFSREQVKWISHCIDRHGDDFTAMARDPKNVWQETPKQIRQKVVRFVGIPEHLDAYVKERAVENE